VYSSHVLTTLTSYKLLEIERTRFTYRDARCAAGLTSSQVCTAGESLLWCALWVWLAMNKAIPLGAPTTAVVTSV